MTGGTSPTVFLVAFVVYIAVMIFIGWYSSRGKSEGTDYLTGGRGLNLLMIFAASPPRCRRPSDFVRWQSA